MRKMIFLLIITSLFFACKTTNKGIIPIQPNYKQSSEVISPNNDGIKDDLSLEGEIKSENFIRYFRLEIVDESKNIVRSIGSEETLEELQKQLFLKKENINIPKKIVWDGKDDDGKTVKDGKYFFRIVIMDNKKNVFNSEEKLKLGEVYVDTVKPDADSKITDMIFSPNNDGNKDTFKSDITSKYDALEMKYENLKGDDWNIDILNAQDEIVKSFKFNDKQANAFSITWDGKNNSGKASADGIYKMKIYSTDKGGNFFEKTVSNIALDTFEDPVEMTLTESIFSPNGDNVKDSLRFNLSIQDKKDIVGWDFFVYSDNQSVRKISGKSDLNDFIDWDGKNDSGEFMIEKQYAARLEVKYKNGNVSKAESIPFNIDLTPPNAEIAVPYSVFSPDNNEIKDKVVITQRTSEEKTEWNGDIYDVNSKLVLHYNWKQTTPPEEIKWDGRDNNGNMMPEGEYNYQLSCRDLAGNLFTSSKNRIVIDLKRLAASIAPQSKVFSPDNNKITDIMEFKIESEKNADNPVAGWSIIIKDKDNFSIFEEKKDGDIPSEYSWNGKTNDNTTAPDGEYKAVLSVNSSYGSTTETTSTSFKVDLTPPVITIDSEPKIFSPDDDGENDILTVNFTGAEDETGIKNWKLIIINPFTKKEFMSFSGEGEPKNPLKWNGKGSNGTLVESVLEYPVKIISEDMVGNSSTKDLSPILIDILIIKQPDGRYKIRISNINFQAEKATMTKDETNKIILDKLTRALKKFPDYTITIEGYANKFRKNLDEKQAMRLSNLRAQTIAEELTARGIAKNRIIAVGKGFENPIIALRDKMTIEELEEMAINRRVEFYLSK